MTRAFLRLAALLLPVVASAGEREHVNLYDSQGRRTGYAVVDRESGRVDYYDRGSRRTGYGTVDATGRAERFGRDGRREPSTVLPVPPRR
jgi:hypothetical protein